MLDNKENFDSKWYKNNLFKLRKVNILHFSYYFFTLFCFILLYFILFLAELEWVDRKKIKQPK